MSTATALLADAETSIKAGDWDQAIVQLENLKKEQPNQPEVYEKLAHALAVRGKFQSVVSTYLELIRVLVEADSLEKADGVVTTVLCLRPESSEARERRIEIENKRGNVARAVYLSRELARLCIDQGDGERSIRLLQDALKHEPGNLDIALELAEMFVSHGHIQDGANQYRKVANAFQAAGNIAKAAEAYRRMKVVQSDDPEVLLTLGRLYTELGRLDEAEQEFRSVLRHDLDHEQALLQLGLVCQLKGRFRSGILAFNKVLQNNPNLVIAKRKLGELHHSQGMMTEAVDFFLQAAQGHLEADEKDDAIECFQIVLSVDENNAPAQQGLTNLGAPVQPKNFEPPQPPQPVADEPPAPEPPPPPSVPFSTPESTSSAAATIAHAPEPVGGSGAYATEKTERLSPINFDAPPATDPEPPKAEPALPKRPLGGSTLGLAGGLKSGSTLGGGGRKGLGQRQGLSLPGGDKPLMGGEKPILDRPGGTVRHGLGQRTLSGLSPVGDKPILPGPGERKPTLREPAHAEAQPAAPPNQRPSFDVPMEEFDADMALENIFDTTDGDTPSVSASDFSVPDTDLFDDDVADDGESALTLGNDLFANPSPPQASGIKIGDFSFDSEEDSSIGPSHLRPAYAQDAPDIPAEDVVDDLFNFDADHQDGPQPTGPPTLGTNLFDDDAVEDDLFTDVPADDLFGEGAAEPKSIPLSEDLFGEPTAESGDPALFNEAPFNLFDEPGDSDGSVAVASGDLLFDDDPGYHEEPLDSLFDEPEQQQKSIPISIGEDPFGESPELFHQDSDLFAEGPDLFGEGVDPVSSPESEASFTPTIRKDSDEGLFGGDGESNDLFNDDIFGEETSGGLNPGFSNPAGADLFETETDAPAGFFSDPSEPDEFGDLDSPLDGAETSALFGVEDGAPSDLFPSDVGQADEAGDLFNSGDGGGLFEELDGGEQNGSPAGLFEEFDNVGEPSSVGLFAPVDSGSDTLFDGFGSDSESGLFESESESGSEAWTSIDSHRAAPSPAFDAPASDSDDSEDLFGATLSIPEPVAEAEVNGDLFGGFFQEQEQAQEDSSDTVQQPDGISLADAGEDDGSLFNIPLTAEPALAFDEALAPQAPDPAFDAESESSPDDSLFGGDSMGDLFGSEALDDSPPPLGLELPMPDEPPLSGESFEPANAEASGSQAESLFEDSDGDLFGVASDFEESLDFDIPAPSEEPVPAPLQLSPEKTSLVEPEPEVESLDPEFMAMLELTMPKAEEEPVPIPEPEPLSLPEFSEPVEIAVALESPEEIFDTPIEIAPSLDEPLEIVEEPPVVEPDPLALMSAEERAEIAQTQQADMLESSLTGADAASKIAAYRKALEETPDNLVLRTRLADIHLKYGLLEDAVVQYRQVMRRSPDSIPLLHRVIQAEFWNENYVEAGDSLLALAKLHLKRGEQHEALDTLQSVLSLDPLHFEARKELVSVFTALDESKLAAHHLRQLAETALTKGEIEGAIQAFQQLLEISADPTFEERLAQIYESQGDVAKALSSFQSLVGRYRAEERWEEAARVTERIVELDPNLLEDREGLIALYKHLGESKRAVEQQFLLARLYQERSDLERAISLYEEVLKFQVDNQDARRHLVDAYLDSGRVSAALEQAEALTEHYLDTKDHSTAIYLYSRLVDADPENVELQERLVKFYGLAGDPENAKTRWVQISNLHERHGRFERAAEAVQKALELDESQIELQHRLALLYAERLQDNQSALTQLRKLFQIAPDRLDAVKMYIDLLLREEQVSEAGQVLQRLEQTGGDGAEIKANVIALLKASVESNPTNLKARFNYGELCYHLGDLDHAIEQFQQTRRHPDYELLSYNMLGLCFASKKGYMMLDLAIKQFQKGLETKGRSEQDYLEIRYNLAMVQYQNGRAKEALAELKECYNVDIAYRDVRSWIQKIEGELASGT